MAATTFMRSWSDFDFVQLGRPAAVPVLDHLLPAVDLPAVAADRRRVHAPLPRGGPDPGPLHRRRVGPGLLVHALYLAVMGIGLVVTARRLEVLLLR